MSYWVYLACLPFLTPVDLNVFPIYAIIIEYPMDITTIKSRLENRFYRYVVEKIKRLID
jgi:hypothetical protein